MFRKKLFLLLMMLFVFFDVAGCGKEEPAPVVENVVQDQPVEIPAEPEFVCPLDGEKIASQEYLDRRAIAVTIENSPAARPQSGLSQADIIYEFAAEGGITRFLAVYLHGEPEVIGPIRSARPYFLDTAAEYDAVYIHCGQSPQAEVYIKDYKPAAINEMYNSKYFWRMKERKPPHNLYSSMEKLRKGLLDKGYADKNFDPQRGFLFDDEFFGGQVAEKVSIRYPGGYTVRYTYDANQENYLRFIGEKKHFDKETQEQYQASNIIIQTAKTRLIPGDKEGRLEIDLIGSGTGYFLRDGRMEEIFWEKKSRTARTKFFAEDGSEIKLKPGQTWIAVVPTTGKINFE